VRPLQLATVPVLVPGFTGGTEVDLPVPCSYDREVAAGGVPPDGAVATGRGDRPGRGRRAVGRPGQPGPAGPGRRRTDAQDMFLAGRAATVQAVLRDLDGGTHLAVTLDDDPGADLHMAHGRFRYFAPDEVEPLGARPEEVGR
jgi:hypothetical protein